MQQRNGKFIIYQILLDKARAVHSHLSIDTGDEFYFFGGYSLSHNGGRDSFSNNEVWSFNFQTKNWHFLGKSKTDFRFGS